MLAHNDVKWAGREAAVTQDEQRWKECVSTCKKAGIWTPEMTKMEMQLNHAFLLEHDAMQHNQLVEKSQLASLSQEEEALLNHVG